MKTTVALSPTERSAHDQRFFREAFPHDPRTPFRNSRNIQPFAVVFRKPGSCPPMPPPLPYTHTPLCTRHYSACPPPIHTDCLLASLFQYHARSIRLLRPLVSCVLCTHGQSFAACKAEVAGARGGACGGGEGRRVCCWSGVGARCCCYCCCCCLGCCVQVSSASCEEGWRLLSMQLTCLRALLQHVSQYS
jgi:hypothetical protein